jgi:ankyrin repeat protein
MGMPEVDEALVFACITGNAENVERLLTLGADPNADDGHCIYTTALDGRADIVKLLLVAGFNTSCKAYRLAMDVAVSKGHTSVMALLQDHAA